MSGRPELRSEAVPVLLGVSTHCNAVGPCRTGYSVWMGVKKLTLTRLADGAFIPEELRWYKLPFVFKNVGDILVQT